MFFAYVLSFELTVTLTISKFHFFFIFWDIYISAPSGKLMHS